MREQSSTPENPGGQRPAARCPRHAGDEYPPPCRTCAEARESAEAWDARQAEQRAALAAELDAARADPRMRCAHGTDGGRLIRRDTGTSPCALCRAEQPMEAS
ncbi:hypothetical protein [Amycolatopsis suaedae]|uniref:Uncharacterized protein n=1 Tax=Amycolatopsis suaedae TaxID=2510978 RepID=A0A4Q7IXY8_9PSEU|nr:hypothetical protein [Amycolatopsis suaedae]RZQ59821.1 hypothetical protein EWH70_32415 [Amycolatopsis suaedae]